MIPGSWVHPVEQVFKLIDSLVPESSILIKPIHHRRQCVGAGAIMCFASLAAVPHQLCSLQYRQVLGDGRLGYMRITSQCVDGLFTLPRQLLENSPARRIGESTEHWMGIGWFHIQTITGWLWFVKKKDHFKPT